MAGIHWFHVIFVAPMLSHIVYKNANKEVLEPWKLIVLSILIVGMLFYHLSTGIKDLNRKE